MGVAAIIALRNGIFTFLQPIVVFLTLYATLARFKSTAVSGLSLPCLLRSLVEEVGALEIERRLNLRRSIVRCCIIETDWFLFVALDSNIDGTLSFIAFFARHVMGRELNFASTGSCSSEPHQRSLITIYDKMPQLWSILSRCRLSCKLREVWVLNF